MTATKHALPPNMGPYEFPPKSSSFRRSSSTPNSPASRPRRRRDEVYSMPLEPPPPKRTYISPRCNTADSKIFPKEVPQGHEQRWQYISKQAGPHKQEFNVLSLSRNVSPRALKYGVTPNVAKSIRQLNLMIVDPAQDILPEWLDVVSSVFHNLEHLSLSDDNDDEDSAKIRRLYVLYRLPELKSIDGRCVTDDERRLARPATPNGQQVHRDEWVRCSSSLFDGLMTDDAVASDVIDCGSSDFFVERSGCGLMFSESSDTDYYNKHDDIHDEIGTIARTRKAAAMRAAEKAIDEMQAASKLFVVDNGGRGGGGDDDIDEVDKYRVLDSCSEHEEVAAPPKSSNLPGTPPGEQREDKSSNNTGSVNNSENRDRAQSPKVGVAKVPSKLGQGDAVEVDLTGNVRSVRLGLDLPKATRHKSPLKTKITTTTTTSSSSPPTNSKSRHPQHRSTAATSSPVHTATTQSKPSRSEIKKGQLSLSCCTSNTSSDFVVDTPKAPSHNNSSSSSYSHYRSKPLVTASTSTLDSDKLDLVSVASTHVEWTGCGSLAFAACGFSPATKQPRKIQGAPKRKTSNRHVSLSSSSPPRKEEDVSLQIKTSFVTPACEVIRENSPANAVRLVSTDNGEVKRLDFGLSPRRSNVVVAPPKEEASPNKKIPPSKSLTSPFPMQFRVRSTTASNLRISTNPQDNSENQPIPIGPRGDISTRATNGTSGPMETISGPIPLARISSSPSKLSASSRRKKELPPVVPSGAARKVIVTQISPLRARKCKKRMMRRRLRASRNSARSTSVLDTSDEDDEDDDDDGNDTETDNEEDPISDEEDQIVVNAAA